MNLYYITNMDTCESGMLRAVESLQKEGAAVKNIITVKAGDNTELSGTMRKKLQESAFIFVAWMGTNRCCDFITELTDYLGQITPPYLFDFTDKASDPELREVSEADTEAISAFFKEGGLENYRRFCCWLENRFCGGRFADVKPTGMPWSGIFYPGEDCYFSYEAYRRKHIVPNRPTIGFIYGRLDWLWQHNELAEALIEAAERHECNIICVFTSTGYENCDVNIGDSLRRFFIPDGEAVVQVVLNAFHFAFTNRGYATFDDLRQLNVPILQTYNIYKEIQAWAEDLDGLSANEIAYAVAMPEFDGIIHGGLAAAKQDSDSGSVLTPVKERVDMLIRKAKRWALLRLKKNASKKVAIIFHNYPPTNAAIGVASALDSIESVRLLLEDLRAAGYAVNHVPENAQALVNELTEHVTNDRAYISKTLLDSADGKFPCDLYRNWFCRLPEKVRKKMEEAWGPPPGNIFVYDNSMLVPGVINGNIFLTVEPPRGFGEDPDKIYHSPDMPPTHQYLGYYFWLKYMWKADVVVFMGTHGSLEWLPGKGTALSKTCYPDICLEDLPDIYPYWITNMGEGTQAKRRAAACLIDYLSAPMSTAGLYDELEELEKLLHEYTYFKLVEETREKQAIIRDMIQKQAAACSLETDILETEDFDSYVSALHTYITDIKNMQISTGLHIFGDAPEGETLAEYILLLTRVRNGSIPSLLKTIGEQHGYDYYELLENSGTLTEDCSMTYGMLLDQIHQEARSLIAVLMQYDFSRQEAGRIFSLPWTQGFTGESRAELLQISEYICDLIAPGLMLTTRERTNFIRALQGDYIEVGSAGAPTSGGADLLPTGRNFYSIDPRKLPTAVAWNIGRQMADDIILRFIQEEGRYPESVGMILWATNNMRSHRECIAEFLFLLGLKPIWQAGSGIVTGSEVIPLEELRRPRIDVTGRISGLFRDSLPGSVDWLDNAVQKVAALDEPGDMNYVRKHVLEDSAELEKKGLDSEVAWRQATYLIFVDAPGAYGAGIDALLESKNWETVADMADVYTRWGAHAYGGNAKGEYLPDHFRKRLSQMDITVFNMDNRESSLLSGDDYNSYRGGLVAAVRAVKGAMPKNYISDSSDRDKVQLRTLKEELTRWFRGEAINPKYIEGMKKHGYKGAADLAGYVSVSFQWDATSETMEDWMYEKYAEKYALDSEMQEWMRKVNPWALKRIAETLLEAEQRGMWNALAETKKSLQKLMLELEADLEDQADI
ncbi:MAG: cobaltochelatase subunit CobN [Acidaminococcaceae bacterium]|nr:cobaltochelatase subunit CobN [Acidaminococcaceae bacterium]